jgi:hypothetical protein
MTKRRTSKTPALKTARADQEPRKRRRRTRIIRGAHQENQAFHRRVAAI